MTSVVSGQSPPSNNDETESWGFFDLTSNGNSQSVSMYSPDTGSLQGFTILGPNLQTSQQSPSPILLNERLPSYPPSTFAEHASMNNAFTNASLVSTAGQTSHIMASASHPMAHFDSLTAADLMFAHQHFDPGAFSQPPNMSSPAVDLSPLLEQFASSVPMLDMRSVPGEGILDLELPHSIRSPPDADPWTPQNPKATDTTSMILDFQIPPQYPPYSQPSPSIGESPQSSDSVPKSPISVGSGKQSQLSSTSSKRVQSGRVSKSKKKSVDATTATTTAAVSSSKFVIVTPTTISASAGKPNPFECFEAMRATQRGRKGPLGNETKENALLVRRLGACFCCHARKVKCDKERPCKNCKKLTVQVPQIVCWQFPDFLPVLFPEFVRGHFRKDEMTKFISENIEGFTVGGIEKPCVVELSSGMNFSAILAVKAKFFTAKTPDVLQHWHLNVRSNEMDMTSRGSVPIGVELDGATRDDLKKKLKEYVSAIVGEPYYAEQTTDAFRHTLLPQKLLKIIHAYNRNAEQPVVRKALSIYAMHYVLTRHMTLTRSSIFGLQHTGMVPRNTPWVTPRVLNRQIKSLVDELLMREMQLIFELLSKLLKPKTRKEWAPCLAAFLVLCLFMEEVETAADRFVISQNEINLRNHASREYLRSFALNINREVEKLPFRQVAYQFHQIYQTHSKDGGLGTAGKAFNPLVDESAMEELDGPATEMVMRLKELITGENWAEADYLSMDPILPNDEDHPYPRDISFNYTGRLVSKFLLSFLNENYILDGNI